MIFLVQDQLMLKTWLINSQNIVSFRQVFNQAFKSLGMLFLVIQLVYQSKIKTTMMTKDGKLTQTLNLK